MSIQAGDERPQPGTSVATPARGARAGHGAAGFSDTSGASGGRPSHGATGAAAAREHVSSASEQAWVRPFAAGVAAVVAPGGDSSAKESHARADRTLQPAVVARAGGASVVTIVPAPEPPAPAAPVPAGGGGGGGRAGELGGVVVAVAFLLAVSGGISAAAGVFRRGSVCGRVRWPGGRPSGPLLAATLAGGGAWFGSMIVYAALRDGVLGPADLAILSVVPGVVGVAVLWFMDQYVVGGAARPLGFWHDRLAWRVWQGIVGAMVAIPLVFAASVLLDLAYKSIEFEHPNEHELLQAMESAGGSVRALLVIGACVAAPVFEEYLFRGHIQTLLVRLFTGRGRPVAAPGTNVRETSPASLPVLPLTSEASETPPLPAGAGELPATPANATPVSRGGLNLSPPAGAWLDLANAAVAPPVVYEHDVTSRRYRLGVWSGIVAASAVFALVHPPWMAPLIFVLAVCLGYAYERTGSLWVTIVMHAAFNGLNTLVVLSGWQ